jgi:hypothetical protein
LKIPALKRGDSIGIEWDDAMTPDMAHWMDASDRVDFREDIKPNRLTGIFLGKDKKYLHVCLCTDAEMDESIGYMLIPVSCITSIRKL